MSETNKEEAAMHDYHGCALVVIYTRGQTVHYGWTHHMAQRPMWVQGLRTVVDADAHQGVYSLPTEGPGKYARVTRECRGITLIDDIAAVVAVSQDAVPAFINAGWHVPTRERTP